MIYKFENRVADFENEIIDKICDDYEFVLNPWRKVERVNLHVKLDYQCFRNYIQNNVYVDEVITDEFCQRQKSKENLEILHSVTVPLDRKDSLFYKLYIALWYIVSSFEIESNL